MTTNAGSGKKKVVVLGGGCGALAAVFALTDKDPGAYDVTVYQPGWRLGGKGASGRNAKLGQRIEEHGLHVWSGFYENAFWMMRKCYAELNRPATHPMATAFTAFRPRHYVAMAFRAYEDWKFWKGYLPHEDGLPGDAINPQSYEIVEPLRRPWQLVSAFLPWTVRYMQATISLSSGAKPEKLGTTLWLVSALARGQQPDQRLRTPKAFWTVLDWLFLGFASARALWAFGSADSYHRDSVKGGTAPRSGDAPAQPYLNLAARLACFQHWAQRKLSNLSAESSREVSFYVQIDLFVGFLVGLLRDGAMEHGFDVLDDVDLRVWLAKHGVLARSLAHPTVESVYCYIFAYEQGDPAKPRLAAGVAARLLMRLLVCSRGAGFWEMRAGMGDTVFAPLYEVLKRRGVKFRFFHRALSVSSNGTGRVDSITLARQVDLCEGTVYHPLVDIKGLDCWPSRPDTRQIVQGVAIDAAYPDTCDLDSSLTAWKDVGTVTLQAGADFDWVVLGISVASLSALCPDLIRHSPKFRDAVSNLATVRTQSMQLWFGRPLDGLGWRLPPPILTGFEKPFDTWADLSDVLEREDWKGSAPVSVQYLCGVMREDASELGGPTADAQARAIRSALRTSSRWLDRCTAEVWSATRASCRTKFDSLTLHVNAEQPTPLRRLASQWLSANIEPSARYVLSLPGSTRFRLSAGDSGYANMAMAGDWLHTGLNFGCVEAAVTGGLKAARVISGSVGTIYGEHDIQPMAGH